MKDLQIKQTLSLKIVIINISRDKVGLGGLGAMCLPQDPRFMGSNPTEVDGFFQDVKILSTILWEGL